MTPPSLWGSVGRALAWLTLPPGSTKSLTSAVLSLQLPETEEGLAGRSLASLRAQPLRFFTSDGEVGDTGFLRVQHTIKDDYLFFNKRGRAGSSFC